MLQVVEMAIGIGPGAAYTPNEILDSIQEYLRAKRNATLDRVEFEERKQAVNKTLDDYPIRIRRITDSVNLCGICYD